VEPRVPTAFTHQTKGVVPVLASGACCLPGASGQRAGKTQRLPHHCERKRASGGGQRASSTPDAPLRTAAGSLEEGFRDVALSACSAIDALEEHEAALSGSRHKAIQPDPSQGICGRLTEE